MKKLIMTLLAVGALSFTGYGKGPAQKYIEQELKTDSLFNNAIIGIMAVDGNGKVIADWNSNLPMLTASTMKTITTGVGLNLLGPDFRFATKVAYSGEIADGILNGDIYIIGGADPTLGSADDVAYAIDSIFGVWADGLENAGIREINGNIVADDSYFVRELIPDSWSWGNLGADYGSGTSGLCFHENTQRFVLTPGKSVGDSVKIEAVYPTIPGQKIINDLTTGAPGSGDRSWYYLDDITRTALYSGSVAVDRKEARSVNSSRFPHLSCAYHFAQYLNENGIKVNGTVADIRQVPEGAERRVVAETFSPRLIDIINVTNSISNNLYAETIFKTIGKVATGTGSYDSSAVAVVRELEKMGVDTYGFTQSDGSGLSRENYVSPKFFCNYYTAMEENANFVSFFNSLPVPGKNGTLKSVLKNEPDSIKGRIHAKSGSLSSVRCYAGYVEGGKKSGLIKFAILTNNYAAYTSQMQPKIEGFLKALAMEK